MKKTYIEPNNTVVKLNLEKMIADSIRGVDGVPDLGVGNKDTEEEGISSGNARESLNAWDEW